MNRTTNVLGMMALLAAGFAASASAQVRHRPVASTVPKVSAVQIAAGKTYGVKDAPIRIDEYSDFECPHCQELYMNTLRPLIDEYVSGGKVYLVHHDFPLPMHTYARQAAYYADAAAAVGRFAQVEQALFVHQAQWAMNGRVEPVVASALSPEKMKQVEALAQTGVVKGAVQADVTQGQQLGINETPTMYITYRGKRTPIIGVVSYPILRGYLDALLRQ
ncbi:MAG: thioredoxin domain-containing protein [Acidobacteriota bacterium]|nr:thioredoxin domain-containing protein [Acidobacteriota bacterium]